MKHLLASLLCLTLSSFCFAQQKTLDDYLQIAVKNSPLLKDLNNQILSAQLDSVRIKAGLKPQVTAGSAGLYAPVIRGYGYSQAITNGQTLDALLSVNKSFISNGYLKAQYARHRPSAAIPYATTLNSLSRTCAVPLPRNT
jgi:outer membrane protein TolC